MKHLKNFKLFESENTVYSSKGLYNIAIQQPFFKEVSTKFPGYNTDESVRKEAVEWLIQQIQDAYPTEIEKSVKDELRNKIND